MNMRLSIAFEDFLGSSIAPQVMPPWCTISNLSQTRLVYNCAQIGKGEYLIWEGEELWPILKGQRKWKLVGHSWSHVCWHHAVSFLVKISKSILQTVCFSFNSWLFEVLSLINLWLNLKLKNEMIRDSHHESLNPEKINQSRLRGHLVSFWVTRSWAQAAKTPFYCQLKSWLKKTCIKLWSLATLTLSIIF